MTRLQPTFQQEYEEYVTGNYIACSLLALVAYEYVVTFDQEVACVWQRKFSAASLLLLSTRWVMLLYQIAAIIPRSQSNCQQWNAFSQLVYFTTVAQIALFSGLRVYALWHDSRFRYVLLAVVLVLGCVPIGTNIFGWTRMQSQWEGPPFSTCLYITHVSKRLNYIMLYVTRGSALTADLLVLVLTWIKTFAHWRQLRRLQLGTSISTLLLRDGTLYFVILIAPNISQIMTYSVRNVNGSSNAANDFLQGLPPILIQRFMLNLRQFGQHEMPGQSTLDDTIATADLNMQFRVPSHLLGNIGEPLSFNSSEVDSAKNADGTAAL